MTGEFLLLIPLLVGALLQRASGMGMSLVAAPFLVLAFGPVDGILVANVCGLLVATVGVMLEARHVAWRRLAILLPAAIVGVVAGTGAARLAAPAILEILVGSILLVGLVVSVAVRRGSRPHATGSAVGSVGAGLGAGAGAALAGLPGPAMAIHAALTGWRDRSLPATLQVLFMGTSAAAIALKLASSDAQLPSQPWPFWAAVLVTLAIGLTVGHLAGRRLPPRWTWRAVIVIATVGSAITIVHGVATLLG